MLVALQTQAFTWGPLSFLKTGPTQFNQHVHGSQTPVCGLECARTNLSVCLQTCVLAVVDVPDAQFSRLWSNCVPAAVTRLLFCDIYGPKYNNRSRLTEA